MQLPLWAPQATWQLPDLGNLPSWAGAKRIAIDVETNDPDLKKLGIGVRRPCTVGGSGMVGFSFAIEDGPKHYLPFRHAGGDNLPEAKVLEYLRENAALFTGDIVGAHLSYDLDYCWEENIHFPNIRFFRDIQIADPIINELHRSYSLDNIAGRLGIPGKDETLLREAAAAFGVDPKAEMWKLPGRFVGEYAEQDAALPLQILRRQERKIDEDDLWEIYDLESKVLPALVRMRRRGVRVDQDKLTQIEEWTRVQESEALAIVKRDTGYTISPGDIWKAAALAPALEEIGIKLTKTATGKPSIDKDILAGIDHPVAQSIARARKVNKLRTTFAASIRRYMVNGRIHCTFRQMAQDDGQGGMKGARYGRLSATDPNLQQQPSRDEFATMWRSIYLPEEGEQWACMDYSSQEPRWTTHFAAEMDLPQARLTAQKYHDDPKLDNHQFMADLTGLPRKFAKCLYLGLCYGEGGAKLCGDLDLPTRYAISTGRGRERKVEFFPTRDAALDYRDSLETPNFYMWVAAGEEGQEIIDKFNSRAPFIRKLAQEAEKVAKRRGYVTTKGGRRLHFPQKDDGSYDWTYRALNRVIQGTSADQTKRALVEIDREGYTMMLQVHDEIDSSISSMKEAEEQAQIMCDVMKGRVPILVDIEVGPNWGEIK